MIRGHTVIRWRAPLLTDEYGQPSTVRDWDNAVALTLSECRIQPAGGGEKFDGRDAVITRWRFLATGHVDVQSTDRIEHAGSMYEVDGEVELWPSPSGRLEHTQAMLQKVVG